MYKLILIIIILVIPIMSFSQVEHVPISHAVYSFLERMETKGLLEHFSTSDLPLQRKDIIAALNHINNSINKLSSSEIGTLELFLTEFRINNRENAVLFYSETNKDQILSDNLFSEKEKLFYYYSDSVNSVTVEPLASAEYSTQMAEINRDVTILTGGGRLFGTLGEHFGYSLQATNAAVISGDKNLALEESKYRTNIKFAELNSDIDFTESHIRYDNDWFYAVIGRESRLLGSGMDQKIFISTISPAFDAVSLGAKFNSFEYRYTHGSLLAIPESFHEVGVETFIPEKYLAMHRFSLRPSWGELSFWEAIIYTDRSVDLAYLNPLSFMKSLEHALRDRDNSIMGLDFVVRPFDNIQIKGTYLLDDIIIDKIGEGYWSNKSAWNIAILTSFLPNIDFGVEYSRVEPYTFSHFNPQNSYTNDQLLLGSNLLPNSDEFTARFRLWWGERYPIELKVTFMRHGDNIYDSDTIVVNYGGDPLFARTPQDSEIVTFLDGDLTELLKFDLNFGYEVIRGFNIHALISLRRMNNENITYGKLLFRLGEF